MSGYYAKVSNVSGGKSCVATSAYMSREKMKDEQMNHTFNYSGHEHDNTFSNVTLCKNAPEEWQDKEKLWNAVEEAEKGKNTRKAKQWILAVPQEMTQEQAEQAVKEFQEWMAEKGMCSQADIHEPDSKRSASQIEKNKHVHVMATQRLINEQGEWERIKEKKVYANCLNAEGKPDYNPDIPNDTAHRIPQLNQDGTQKVRVRPGKGEEKLWERVKIQSNPLDNRELIEESRAKWAEVCNKHLSAEQQIDHRSYDRQGIDKVAEIHEGIGAHHDGDSRSLYNQEVRKVNALIEEVKQYAAGESENNDRDHQRPEESDSRTSAEMQFNERRISRMERTGYETAERLSGIAAEHNGEPSKAGRISAGAGEMEECLQEAERSIERSRESEGVSRAESGRTTDTERYVEECTDRRRARKQDFDRSFRGLRNRVNSAYNSLVAELKDRFAAIREQIEILKVRPQEQTFERRMENLQSRTDQIRRNMEQARADKALQEQREQTREKSALESKMERAAQRNEQNRTEGESARIPDQEVPAWQQKFNRFAVNHIDSARKEQEQEQTEHTHHRRGRHI